MINSKRAQDIAASLVGLAGFAPLMGLISLAIVLEDGRPVFFRHQRQGLSRVPFEVIKFRTMRGDNTTRIGRWTRATGLDELPQFLNVLRGEMSMVGPRPLDTPTVDRLGWNKAEHDIRWTIKPGVTGLAQILAGQVPSNTKEESWALDQLYARLISRRLDNRIIAISFAVNLFGKRRIRQKVVDWRLLPTVNL